MKINITCSPIFIYYLLIHNLIDLTDLKQGSVVFPPHSLHIQWTDHPEVTTHSRCVVTYCAVTSLHLLFSWSRSIYNIFLWQWIETTGVDEMCRLSAFSSKLKLSWFVVCNFREGHECSLLSGLSPDRHIRECTVRHYKASECLIWINW